MSSDAAGQSWPDTRRHRSGQRSPCSAYEARNELACSPYFGESPADRHDVAMNLADRLLLQFEVLAVASRLRRQGDPDLADLVEEWAASPDLIGQLKPPGRVSTSS